MNKIYRIVFNTVSGRWVVASEMAKGRTKSGGSQGKAVGAVLFVGLLGSLCMSPAAFAANGGALVTCAEDGTVAHYGTGGANTAGTCTSSSYDWGLFSDANPDGSAGGTNQTIITGNKDGTMSLYAVNGLKVTSTMDMGNYKITGLGNGTAASDAATYGQLVSATKYFHVNSALADSVASAANSIAIGGNANASGGTGAIAIGSNASAQGGDYAGGSNSVALGAGANADGTALNWGRNTAIGGAANANTTNGVAVGYGTVASGNTATALGYSAKASAGTSLALGSDSVADRASGIGGSTKGAVSVGSGGAGTATDTRQIISVARGTQDTDAVNVSQLKGVTTALGGGAAVNADGTLKAPGYALANANTIGGTSGAAADVGAGFAKVDGALGAMNTKVTQNTSDIAGNTTSISNLQTTVNNISNGSAGLVQQSAAGANLTVGKGTDGVAVDFADKSAAARKLLSVANGNVVANSTDAVNGGQLFTTNQAVAQNASDISTLGGRVTTAEGNISTLNTKVNNIDGRVTQNTTDIAGNTTSISNLQTTVNNISNGSVGLVQQSAAGANLTVGKGTDGVAVDFADKNAAARKLLSVANGNVVANSTEAVNGGQLFTTNQAVAQNASDISTLGGRVTTAEGNISTINTKVNNIDGRVTQNTSDIATINNTIAGMGTVMSDAVVYDSAAHDKITLGNAGTPVQVTNVKAGVLSGTSSDAVNGSQLFATNQAVAQNTSAIGTLDGRVTANEGDITTLKTDVTTIDGRVTTAEDNITSLDNRVTNNETSITTLKTDVTKIDNRVTTAEGNISTLTNNVSTLDGRVSTVEGSVTNITNQLNSGEIGLVQYDDAAGSVTVAKDKAGTAVDFRGTAGARRLKGVAAGGEDEDAVNVSQLKKVTDAMGGGASVNADGSITAPTYYVTNADGSKSSVSNMGDAVSNIDGRVYNNTTAISTINQQISSGTIGLVQQASAGAKLTVGKDTDGTEVDFADNAGNARKLTNVADGTVAAGSKDAVNGGQLHAVSQSMASALGGGSMVNADGTVTAPTYTVTNADGSTSQVNGVEGAISNIDNRTYQNTTAITNNTTAINNLTTQISNGEVGLVKQDAATRQITVAKDSDGDSVSVAGTAGDRVVTGVASAKADNDAVNLGQLKAAGVISANGEAKSVMTYDDAGKTSMTMGGEGASSAVTIHNVADGVADHDAVNVSQLNTRLQQNTTEVLVQANSYTDQKIDDVWNGMNQLDRQVQQTDRRVTQHGAMAVAHAQMASGAAAAAVGNPNGAWSVGLGSEQGYGAISAGYAKPVGKKSQISFGASFSGDERSVGVGFAHKL